MSMNHRFTILAAGAASVALVVTSGVALAAGDTHLAWEGYATNTGSVGCTGVGGTGTGDTHVSIYRPKLGATDPSPTFLSFMHLRAALTFQNTSAGIPQMNGAGNYTGVGINSRAKSFSFTGTYKLTVSPNPVVSTTSVVNISGTINNYFNTAGCSVTFKGIYVKRID